MRVRHSAHFATSVHEGFLGDDHTSKYARRLGDRTAHPFPRLLDRDAHDPHPMSQPMTHGSLRIIRCKSSSSGTGNPNASQNTLSFGQPYCA